MQWHRTCMKQTQAQKSDILEQGSLPWHQGEMNEELLNYSLQQKRKVKKKIYKKKEKKTYKKWSYFIAKNLRGCKKRVTRSAKLITFLLKSFQILPYLFLLSLFGIQLSSISPKASPVIFKLYWQRVKKKKKEAKNESWISQQILRLGGVFSYPSLCIYLLRSSLFSYATVKVLKKSIQLNYIQLINIISIMKSCNQQILKLTQRQTGIHNHHAKYSLLFQRFCNCQSPFAQSIQQYFFCCAVKNKG